jgi:hypothetical protein
LIYLIIKNIIENIEFNAITILNSPITKSGIEVAELNNLKKKLIKMIIKVIVI